jgi:hypothetical protein
MIERDFDIPLIADPALREKQIQQNYRPVIAVHKWFAKPVNQRAPMHKYPFEVGFDQIQAHPDHYVDAVFSCLESEFLIMPRGRGFVPYDVFESGYEALKKASDGFRKLEPAAVFAVVKARPISFVVN